MTLEEIIKIADDHYPDGLIQQAHLGEDVGDGLASFIAAELEETYCEDDDSVAQLSTVITVLDATSRQVDALIKEFESVRAKRV